MSDVNQADLRADWTDHPYAGVARKMLDDLLSTARSSLYGACSQSTDPKVRGAFDKMRALEQAAQVLAKGARDG